MPEAFEWPDDEIVDAPPAAPAFLAPPMPQARPVPQAMPVSQATPALLPPPAAPTAPPAPPPLLPTPPAPTRMAPPPPPKRSSALPVIVIGTLAAAAVAVIAVAVIASGGDDPKTPPALGGTPVASLPPAAAPSGPVDNIALADHGDNAVVTWEYPSGASGPVIVSAATAGNPMRPMQSLPAGTETYTLVNLNPQLDYCVTVTIAYSPENMVMAPQVCTKRK